MMGAFGPPPDLVLVGVNHGLNIGRGLIHSSTVGAAFTGAVHHVPAAAFSADSPGSGAGVDWAGWHPTLVGLVEALSDRGSADGVLSVNLPARDRDGGDPVWCRVADATAVGRLNVVALPAGGFGCGVTYGPLDELPPADTDAGVVARGRVALTWLPLPYGGAGDPSWPAEFPTRRDVLT
jgi:5'-nucleotidase